MKKTVFLTGATGNMGKEGLQQLITRLDKFNITVLVLPSEKDKKIIAPYENMSGLKVVYDDLTKYNDVLKSHSARFIGLKITIRTESQRSLALKRNGQLFQDGTNINLSMRQKYQLS